MADAVGFLYFSKVLVYMPASECLFLKYGEHKKQLENHSGVVFPCFPIFEQVLAGTFPKCFETCAEFKRNLPSGYIPGSQLQEEGVDHVLH